MMEDIVKIKTGWARSILSKVITSALKNAGYEIEIAFDDVEAHDDDDHDCVIADVRASVKAKKSAITKLLK